jgi:anti-sigma B factor antagonist
MAPTESPLVSVSHRRMGEMSPRDAARTVVSLRGEHDLSTTAEVTVALARAIALDDDDLEIDLSGVEFMGAETIGIIIRTRGYLRSRSRELVLRSPSRLARRVVDLCGLAQLIAPHPTDATPTLEAAGALGSWVAVPASDRVAAPVPAVVSADVEVEPALALAGRAPVIAPPSPNVASLPGP